MVRIVDKRISQIITLWDICSYLNFKYDFVLSLNFLMPKAYFFVWIFFGLLQLTVQ
jgi:hypothetical protein